MRHVAAPADTIEEHALLDVRIARLSPIREFVLGIQDGLFAPLGVVTGMAAANPGRGPILVAGLAEAVAGCIAMCGGPDAPAGGRGARESAAISEPLDDAGSIGLQHGRRCCGLWMWRSTTGPRAGQLLSGLGRRQRVIGS